MRSTRKERLDEVAHVAARIQQDTRVPAVMLIAQWAAESKWGEKLVGHANYFGIKRADRHDKFCLVTTREVFSASRLMRWNEAHPDRLARNVIRRADGKFDVTVDDEFADYDDLAASCADYAWLISHGRPYARAWNAYQQDHDVPALIRSIASVYATDPNYAKLLLTIANQSNVLDAINRATELPA